ncbi:MAG: twin-arginine translocation signal domain-containing protein [Arenicellaceae bacterium]|nr:twin-arginine translocation signal domain-containing protein [Arenicellaceae bacterium]
MSKHDEKHLEAILEQVSPTRRKFLRSSLIAGGAAVLAAPVSSLLAR